MHTDIMRQNIAADPVILSISKNLPYRVPTTKKMKTDVGFGRASFRQKATAEPLLDRYHRWHTGLFGKSLEAQFLKEWFLTINVASAPVLIQTTCVLLRSVKTIIWARLCAVFLLGAAFPTHQRNITFADLFIAPPEPKPKQEAMF